MSDPVSIRLERRCEELMKRVELLEAEAAGVGEWSDGARLALHAAWDEMHHLRDLYELRLLLGIRQRWSL